MSNQLILEKLNLLATQYKKDPSLKFKYSALVKAIRHITQYPYAITSGKMAKENLPNIGDGISRRIDEILTTNNLKELDNQSDPQLDAIGELCRITGVGEARAKVLVKQGITMIDQYVRAIKDGKVKSTHHIDIGIRYLKDFEIKIPRDEIQEMEKVLRAVLARIDPKLIIHICGSYRRERKFCGDIDILITHQNPNPGEKYLKDYVATLTKMGFIIDDLTNKGDKKYMGVCRLNPNGPGRRIDIRFVDYVAYYAALIYFTGSRDFNIDIRNHALEKGYSLSEYGFKERKTGQVITHHSEQEIFDFLGLPFVTPKDRDV